jgi:hypothetical protein
MGSIRQSLQAQKHRKLIETPNQPIHIKIFSNKSKFSTSYGGYPTEFAGSTQNPKPNIRTPKFDQDQDENFSKISMPSTLKKKMSQKFAGSTQNVKKNCWNIKSTN